MEDKDKLTGRNFWIEFWKKYTPKKIPHNVPFSKFLPNLKDGGNMIEIGGFPGIFTAYFYKNGIDNVSLLDYYIDENIVRRNEEINNIPPNTISCIETDFFTFKPEKKFDVVFSFGFIEHFENIEEVIHKHIELLSVNGRLMITLPNFRGLNGFVQKIFDKENLRAHNLNCMNPELLESIALNFGLKNVVVEYGGNPSIWLDESRNGVLICMLTKIINRTLNLLPPVRKVSTLGRFLSPYIFLYAENNFIKKADE